MWNNEGYAEIENSMTARGVPADSTRILTPDFAAAATAHQCAYTRARDHASLADALTVALAHLIFNLSATVLIYVPPFMRKIPIRFAESLGRLGAHNRALAGAYILLVFFGLPLLLLFVTGTL